MKQTEKTRNLLIAHYEKYPKLQIQDILKYIYQSSFGCEHMVSSLESATSYIRSESEKCISESTDIAEALDGNYSRVHLSCIKKGVNIDELGELFFLSAKKEVNGLVNLEEKLGVAKALVTEGALPFSAAEFDTVIEKWKAEGYPPLHHSDVFRENYHPSYRVIANRYVGYIISKSNK